MMLDKLIAQLNAWSAIHGDMPVAFSHRLGDVEVEVFGACVGEGEDGSKVCVIFAEDTDE